MLAAQMLAEGHDAPALRRAAGYSRRDDPRDIRQEFGQALEELGAWLPDRGAAELAAGMCLAHALLSGALTVAECSRRALGTWDFDDVIYPGLPGDLKDLGANVPPARHRALRSEWRRRAAAGCSPRPRRPQPLSPAWRDPVPQASSEPTRGAAVLYSGARSAG